MKCDRARRLFGACWDDELTQAERDWLEGHLAACAHCRAEYDEFSRVLELAGSLPRAEASADLLDRVLAQTRRAQAARDRLGEPTGLRWVPVAAAAAVLVVGALFLVPHLSWRSQAPGADSRVAAGDARGAAPRRQVAPGAGLAWQTSVSVRMPERRRDAAARVAAIPDSLFDHSEDVEFILDPVTLQRGRASVSRADARQPGVEGEQAIITF